MCNKPKKSRPTRKTRTRTRKPKFLSLLCLDAEKKSPISDQLSEKPQLSGSMSENSQLSGESSGPQLTLFPLHPENHHDDQNDSMAYTLFSSSDDNSAATLSELLNTAKIEPFSTSETDSPINCAYRGHDNDTDGVLLVRTALRNRERDASEEVKWVCCSEVSSVCFSGGAGSDRVRTRQNGNGNGVLKLDLKLDYEGILNAWCDKGEVFLERECCSGDDRSVPDLSCDDLLFNLDAGGANVLMDGLWRVPEKSMVGEGNGEGKLEDGKWKIGQSREASVLRYKEKRQSRLFSKQIRYQVRKLNAEKRPRIKGRFVKRS